MRIALDVIAAWTALDVVLLVAWHAAHVSSRRQGARPRASRPAPPTAVPSPRAAVPFARAAVPAAPVGLAPSYLDAHT